MKLLDLLRRFSTQLANDQESAAALDELIESGTAQKFGTTGALHLYSIEVPEGTTLLEDAPVTIVPPGDMDPTGGYILRHQDHAALVQTQDSLGQSTVDNTLVSDTATLFKLASKRLADIAAKPESYALGPVRTACPLAGSGTRGR